MAMYCYGYVTLVIRRVDVVEAEWMWMFLYPPPALNRIRQIFDKGFRNLFNESLRLRGRQRASRRYQYPLRGVLMLLGDARRRYQYSIRGCRC